MGHDAAATSRKMGRSFATTRDSSQHSSHLSRQEGRKEHAPSQATQARRLWRVMIKYKCWKQGRTTSRYDLAQITGSMTPSVWLSGFRIVRPWLSWHLIGRHGGAGLPAPLG